MSPKLSSHFQQNTPSAIRKAQQLLLQREDKIEAIDAAIGNVTLPMHPAMQERLFNLDAENSPFKNAVVKYSTTQGFEETNQAFKNILESSDIDTKNLYTQVVDGGSHAMELVILGVADNIRNNGRPILMIDPAYTNYLSMARRTDRRIVTFSRRLDEKTSKFTLPDFNEIEKIIIKEKPAAIIIIPYDNPTGQLFSRESLIKLAKLAVQYDMWIISDEAYRELYYTDTEKEGKASTSIWKIDEKQVPGIIGRRISIETASKVWNACGLRMGAIITDSKEFSTQSIAENSANLCPNVIGQYIFGALAHESKQDLQKWYAKQRKYYMDIMFDLNKELKKRLPGIIISEPEAAIYSVADFRDITDKDFNSGEFVAFCASKGCVKIKENGDVKDYTLLTSPMAGFYNEKDLNKNPGRTQIRLSYVEPPERIALIPELLEKLFLDYGK